MPEAVAQSLTMKKVTDRFREEILQSVNFRGEETIVVRKEKILDILRFLRDDPDLQYNFLMDIGGVDYLAYPDQTLRGFGRFGVVYQLYSQKFNTRFRYDQLMRLGWKVLLPLGLLNIFVTGVVLFFLPRAA